MIALITFPVSLFFLFLLSNVCNSEHQLVSLTSR
jgi:hypothetical protein